ncbi:F-box protein At5g07610-like [Camellia sinensis]|uniref:F-box protein At5g07610-like n=1 Tax=Camellia sinensis TaxID=4442 RepID=UPI0010357B84|nr:F-box protein At5g07610-like [Camellia sinensis]
MINITTSSSTRTNSIIGCSSSSTALEAVVSNKDLLTQILLCVPPKSLLRFKSVSKNWFLLIFDSQFSFNHARQNQPNHSIVGLYFCYDYWCSMKQVMSVSLHDNASLPTLSFLNGVGVERDSKIKIHSSCNGLLQCESSQFADLNVNRSYIICNVTTQKYKLLPQTCQHLSRSYAYLAFDPSKSLHYKVLLVFERIDKFNIYSSESSSWKQIDLTTGPSYGEEELFGMEQSIG